jgi:hypothetical protein
MRFDALGREWARLASRLWEPHTLSSGWGLGWLVFFCLLLLGLFLARVSEVLYPFHRADRGLSWVVLYGEEYSWLG